MKATSLAADCGRQDGAVSAWVRPERTASDAFVRRTALLESARREYTAAFDAAFAASRRLSGGAS